MDDEAAMNRPHGLQARPQSAHGAGLFIDAGVGHVRLRTVDGAGGVLADTLLPSSALRQALTAHMGVAEPQGVYITGKLAGMAREVLGRGMTFLPAATAWLAAQDRLQREPDAAVKTLGLVELSASGYLVVGVERTGALKDDLLVVNPRCGAGSGINLDRVLQKLGLAREDVDALLADYLGEEGREHRERVSVRADRCGVFASSATISDKNQGIPLDMALATTLKSEVLKACKKLPPGFDKVVLAGRVFHWRYARDCAADHLRAIGVRELALDPDNTQALESLRGLAGRLGPAGIAQPEPRVARPAAEKTYPAFAEIRRRYAADHRYLRLAEAPLAQAGAEAPVLIGLDVGSTMAKLALAHAGTGETLYLAAYSNAGDTIQTIQQAFAALAAARGGNLKLRGIGLTGSARYQAREALTHIYPELAGRVQVLVENYAHARGSIDIARRHVERLKADGVAGVNEELCILVDIGGEDTKISTLALKEAELFNNAMNLKCSAGTGSLMDTLTAMFGMPDVGSACAEAAAAPKAHRINATCAVFLMENARKLQARGVGRAEILASANWAIVENMARSLWPQVDLPPNSVVLLHGQTMRSEPLPLAVTDRLQSYLGAPCYAVVPPHPGHRACLGLIRTLAQTAPADDVEIPLARFIDARFDKRIVQCHGAVCDDKAACCNRSLLTCRDEAGKKRFSFTLGGCGAINELLAKKKGEIKSEPVRDTYKAIWDFIAAHQPRSEDPRRLVIPRSFSVSEWAYFLARFFERLGLPVQVDEVREQDLLDAQPLFNVDTCAPHMGAVGQYRRLAAAPHGMILAPQIEFLPTGGRSLGRTCTTNQGGVAVAANLARLAYPGARFHLFNVDLRELDADVLAAQLGERLRPVFEHYDLDPAPGALREALAGALDDHVALRAAAADLAADLIEAAQAEGVRVALVVGREYVLNPGLYDSHVRRLLRDKRMAAIPSYVLDLELDADYAHVYWRNPHFMVSLLAAVARRELHRKLRHPRLAEAFRRIESGPDLLPAVQVSTFSCGPDSVTAPFVAEIMKRRPFLLIQSDAVIKELAHLENRVNTYVKQLELGLHEKLALDTAPPFEIRMLDDLVNRQPLDRDTDVIYLPTMADNRTLAAVLRGAGYACIDNYDENYDLQALVSEGRRATGDAVCAPLAAVWGDLTRAVEDFRRRQRAGDPLVGGRQRLLYFDNQGTGPCRQGQYAEVHRLLAFRHLAGADTGATDAACAPGGGLKFLLAAEDQGYDIGLAEWTLARCYLGAILQGVLQGLAFAGAECRDYEEYRRFRADHRALEDEILRALEAWSGPGPLARHWLRLLPERGLPALSVKYFAYRLRDRRLTEPLRRFAATWMRQGKGQGERLKIVLSGEVYMRVSQADAVFRGLLAELGFRRFRLEHGPLWGYLEYLLANAEQGPDGARRRQPRLLRLALRHLLAAPLYRAARLPMPPAAHHLLEEARELLPTLRPAGELPIYAGEALEALRGGADLFLNVAPNGCMVSSMGEALGPALAHAAGGGRIQPLFSADGEVNEELLGLAVLKVLGPEGYYRATTASGR
ncbi:MAG: acyl-CoA dehydratase activase-related protein [Pseudomonadota bacterium]